MTDQITITAVENPYSAPESSLRGEHQEFYEPKIFSFKGRIGRLRYLAYGIGTYLILMAVFMPLLGGTMLMGTSMGVPGAGEMSIVTMIAMGVFYIAVMVLGIAFAKRRLNDLNRSGWWVLTFIIPLVNLLMTIYVLFFPGSNEANDYGPPPVANSLGVKILGSLLPIMFLLGIIAAVSIPAYQEYVTKAGQSQTQ